MNKKPFMRLITGMTMLAMSSTAFALVVQNDPAITNPASTENLWAYSYQSYASYIANASDYVRAGDPYTDAIFQGYVTGANGPWSGTGATDSWGSGGISDTKSVHVFDTYITSAIDQTVTFTSRGDDGHSVFIDDLFQDGSGYYPTNYTVTATLDMVANTEYKLTYIAANYSGPFAWWFKMSGIDIGGAAWAGSVSEAHNITMNANPVPIPAAVWLFGSGLVGLIGFSKRKNAKAAA